MKTDKILPTILLVAVVLIVACLLRCPFQPKAEGQEKAEQSIQQELFTVEVRYPSPLIRVTIGDNVSKKEYITDYPWEMFLGLMAMHSELKYYEMECYPDSVRFIPPNTFERLDPTFTGFIKFLDKRFKGEK